MVPAICSRSVSHIYPEMHVPASPQASRPYQLLPPSYFNFGDTQTKQKEERVQIPILLSKAPVRLNRVSGTWEPLESMSVVVPADLANAISFRSIEARSGIACVPPRFASRVIFVCAMT